jgi:hypothetical protein
MKMEQCSEMSAYKIQTPRNYPEEKVKHSEHGESLKSRMLIPVFRCTRKNFAQFNPSLKETV